MVNPNKDQQEKPAIPTPSSCDENGNPLKQCNWCKEMIHFDALICPHCRKNPDANAKEAIQQQSGIRATLIIVSALIIVLIILQGCQELLMY